MRILPKFIIYLFIFICACSHSERNNLLFEHINTLTDVSPDEAIALLNSIDSDTMSEVERHHYDLLTIKAYDKAYIRHTSDSLIRDVLDYYSSHTSDPLYPEALYYGGRVYSDLGDYPTAIQYFRNALDNIPDNKENLALRGVVLSQTGRLLDGLRIYSEAIPYIKESIEISKHLNDTIRIAYDSQLLSGIYIHAGKLDSALTYIEDAIRWSSTLSDSDQADIRIDLASILYEKGDVDSSLQIIRPLVNLADSICRNYALAVASEIYRDAGITDTAYVYALELAMSKNPNNRKTGFQVLFSSELENIVPKDTLLSYIPKYKQCIEHYLNTHEAQFVSIQQSNYNYTRHVRAKEDAESHRDKMLIILFATLVITALLIVVVLYLRLRNSILIAELNKTMALINNAKNDDLHIRTEEMEKYLDEMAQKFEKYDYKFKVSDAILKSDTYMRLREYIRENKSLHETDGIWQELEQLIEQIFPGFKSNLWKFSDGKATAVEVQVALLIKCGISPSEMAKLLNRAKNTISTRRKSLFVKIFGKDRDPKILDNFILYLGNY